MFDGFTTTTVVKAQIVKNGIIIFCGIGMPEWLQMKQCQLIYHHY